LKISKSSNELSSALRENEREYYSDIVITPAGYAPNIIVSCKGTDYKA